MRRGCRGVPLLSTCSSPGALGVSRPKRGDWYPSRAAGRFPWSTRCHCRTHRCFCRTQPAECVDMSTQLVIIGGSDAGISAGLRARELDPNCEVTIVVADRFPNYSICGLPFYLSGEVRDWRALAHRTIEELTGAGLSLLLEQSVQEIDPDTHCVTVVDEGDHARYLRYDRLIIATGVYFFT